MYGSHYNSYNNNIDQLREWLFREGAPFLKIYKGDLMSKNTGRTEFISSIPGKGSGVNIDDVTVQQTWAWLQRWIYSNARNYPLITITASNSPKAQGQATAKTVFDSSLIGLPVAYNPMNQMQQYPSAGIGAHSNLAHSNLAQSRGIGGMTQAEFDRKVTERTEEAVSQAMENFEIQMKLAAQDDEIEDLKTQLKKRKYDKNGIGHTFLTSCMENPEIILNSPIALKFMELFSGMNKQNTNANTNTSIGKSSQPQPSSPTPTPITGNLSDMAKEPEQQQLFSEEEMITEEESEANAEEMQLAEQTSVSVGNAMIALEKADGKHNIGYHMENLSKLVNEKPEILNILTQVSNGEQVDMIAMMNLLQKPSE